MGGRQRTRDSGRYSRVGLGIPEHQLPVGQRAVVHTRPTDRRWVFPSVGRDAVPRTRVQQRRGAAGRTARRHPVVWLLAARLPGSYRRDRAIGPPPRRALHRCWRHARWLRRTHRVRGLDAAQGRRSGTQLHGGGAPARWRDVRAGRCRAQRARTRAFLDAAAQRCSKTEPGVDAPAGCGRVRRPAADRHARLGCHRRPRDRMRQHRSAADRSQRHPWQGDCHPHGAGWQPPRGRPSIDDRKPRRRGHRRRGGRAGRVRRPRGAQGHWPDDLFRVGTRHARCPNGCCQPRTVRPDERSVRSASCLADEPYRRAGGAGRRWLEIDCRRHESRAATAARRRRGGARSRPARRGRVAPSAVPVSPVAGSGFHARPPLLGEHVAPGPAVSAILLSSISCSRHPSNGCGRRLVSKRPPCRRACRISAC